MTAPSITLAADNFVPDDVFPNPGNTGSFIANSFDITTGQDFYTPSNLNSVDSLTINAPGSITTGRIDTVDFLDLTAQAGSLSIPGSSPERRPTCWPRTMSMSAISMPAER